MGQGRPSVREGMLHLSAADTNIAGTDAGKHPGTGTGASTGAGTIRLGSEAWYAWLEQHSIFLFETPFMHFTARKERRSSGWYWYAYRRMQGKLRTAYLGKSHELTLERLHAVANGLQAGNPTALETASLEGPASTPHTSSHSYDPQQGPSGAPPPPFPTPLTPLVGREHDVAVATDLMLRPDVRLLSLVGTGGVGKTRLAMQIAANLREHFTDGVYFVALAPVRDPQLVLSTIGQVLGLKEDLDEPLADLVKAFLQQKHLLLVLDNFEQVMPAAPLLADLLSACSTLKLLVTSREILHMCAEHHFPVAPLAFPDLDHLPAIESLSAYPAVDLFLRRAQAIVPDMATNPATIRAIAQICARLEGLPLAIELAAARVRLLPPQALATRLERRLEVLTQGGPDMPERHQTLRATFAWSRDLLTPEEQRLFRRISVFVSGFTLEAAEAVCNVFDDLPDPFLNVISSLVDKSLLHTRTRQGQEPRLYLLETVREYALECLLESGEMARTQQAHAAYYVAFAEDAEPELYRHEQYAWLDRLDADNENLRAAFSYLLGRPDRARAVRLAGALGWFWYMRGRLSEGLDWSEQALHSPSTSEAISSDGKALSAAGLFASYLGQRDRARTHLQASLAVARAEADACGFARAAFALSQLYLADGDVASAQAQAEEALTFVRGTDDVWTLALVLDMLGLVTMCLGDLLGAGVLCERSAALFTEAGDLHMRDQVLLMVGNALLAQGDETRARNMIEDLIESTDAGRTFRTAGWVLCAYGEIALQQGDGTRARFLLEQALAQSRRLGNKRGMARSYALLAQVALAAEDSATARTIAIQSLEIAGSEGDKATIATCLEGMADIAARHGHTAWAVRLWAAAERQSDAGGHEPACANTTSGGRKPLIEAARRSLGEQQFHANWAEGRALPPEHALAHQAFLHTADSADTFLPHTLFVQPAACAPIDRARPAGLTRREMDALLLVADGLSNDEIAERLVVSPATVKTYLSAIYSKLGVSSRTAAMRYAIDHHLHMNWTVQDWGIRDQGLVVS